MPPAPRFATLGFMLLPRTIATVVDNVARSTIGKDWSLYAALLSHWTEIVGPDYAEVTTPVKISFPKGKPSEEKWAQHARTDGVLHVRLPQGLTMEFTARSEQIRSRIAAYFGYPAIERIMFEPYYHQASEPPRTKDPADPQLLSSMKEQAQGVENDDLRQALEKLGEALLTDRH